MALQNDPYGLMRVRGKEVGVAQNPKEIGEIRTQG